MKIEAIKKQKMRGFWKRNIQEFEQKLENQAAPTEYDRRKRGSQAWEMGENKWIQLLKRMLNTEKKF